MTNTKQRTIDTFKQQEIKIKHRSNELKKQYTKIENTIMNQLYNRMNQLDKQYESVVNEIALCNSLVNEIKMTCEQHDKYINDKESERQQLINDIHDVCKK